MKKLCSQTVAVGVLLMASGTATAAEAPAKAATGTPAEPRITLSLKNVPLRAALAELYPEDSWEITVDPCIPDTPITADLKDFPRSRALAFLARAAGGPLIAVQD